MNLESHRWSHLSETAVSITAAHDGNSSTNEESTMTVYDDLIDAMLSLLAYETFMHPLERLPNQNSAVIVTENELVSNSNCGCNQRPSLQFNPFILSRGRF